MAKIKLSLVCRPNERALPIIDRTVDVEGVELDYTDAGTPGSQLLSADVSEMSLVSYLKAREQGANLVMVPVFPTRDFVHARLATRADSGIKEPKDLTGKRLGFSEDEETWAMWARGILEHDFGAANVRVVHAPAGKSAASMLNEHEADAVPIPYLSGADSGKITPLFSDVIGEGSRFLKQHGFMPAEHTYVIRGDLYERYPWLAFNFFKAFLEAKDVYKQRLGRSIPSGLIFGPQYLRNTQRVLGEDPFPSGLKANRDMLQTLVDYSHEQGLTRSKPNVDELVPANIRDLDPAR